MDINKLISLDNIADELPEDQLKKIGSEVVRGFKADFNSRRTWEEDLEKWTNLAIQIVEEKTYPWRKASNVKYPLLSTAAMQFNARAYPTLVPSDGKIVKCKTIGGDPQGLKTERARRVSSYLSYQVLEEMDNWEYDMDRLLLILPITGTVFKKTYFDSSTQKNVSSLVYPTDLVVNHWAKSLEEAERKTEILYMSGRKIKERQLQKIFRDVELPDAGTANLERQRDQKQGFTTGEDDETTPYQVLEQHCFLDLDDDGYAEPYIVVVERSSAEVLRIVARYYEEDVLVDNKGTVVKITPIEYYTKYSFVPNPDGGFYDIGFGRLLGSINASVDTLVNQLIDAGTLNNLQSGFIGKGLRIKMGESAFRPGEWKVVNATGDDIKKQIFSLPTKEPSNTLLELLKFLVQSGKELASVAEIFTGKLPGQNTPATTTQMSVQEGMRIFTAVYKRIYRSLTKEFRKLYKLNAKFLELETYVDVIDEEIGKEDFSGPENDIVPAADPQATSSQEKQTKGQFLLQLLSLGTLNPIQVTSYLLDAYEIPNKEQFMIQQPQPSPEQQAAQQESQAKQQDMQMKQQLASTQAQHKIQVEERKAQIAISTEKEKAGLEQQKQLQDIKYKQLEAVIQGRLAAQQGMQGMQQKEMTHRQAMRHAEEANKTKQKDSPNK